MTDLLEVRNLTVDFGAFHAVEGVDLTVAAGEVLCVVGESGSGKSVSMLAVMGLLPSTGRVAAERVDFRGADLLHAAPRARRRLIGGDMAMVFQEPTTSLNPCYPIGWQIAEALRAHDAAPRAEIRARVVALLAQVGVPAPDQRVRAFPHQLSGGLNQRAMIAMAIACNPALLIADEPTTALDVTVQKGVLDLLVGLQRDRGMGLVLITHDMGVVAETAQRVQVMYAGQVMEEQPAAPLFAHPRHPYTAALLDALPERAEGKPRLPTIPGVVPGAGDRPAGCLFAPRCRFRTPRCDAERPALRMAFGARVRCHYPLDDAGQPHGPAMTVLQAIDVVRHYPVGRKALRAVEGVSFRLEAGSTLAVVGESGCGKSTLARLAALMEPPTAGAIEVTGQPAAGPARRTLQLQNQMVFQNPYASLNPRRTIGEALIEPLAINRRGRSPERAADARQMLERVGLRPEAFDRYPHQFSGGQRQRVAIARALMLRPAVVTADEPVSALDVSVQAQVLNLMRDLQDELGIAYLFISHDISVVRHMAQDVLVMYAGRPAEQGPADAVLKRPRHPYTQLLLASTPFVDPARRAPAAAVRGEPPSPVDPIPGCAFTSRCPFATDRCRIERPLLRPVDGRLAACHYAETTGA